ncbi:hypothetical protein PUMCH_004019 [Australozyma saopauloensis]|uniref:Mitochondrial group I intron splicing factor CCM1 n=1 Tax=Australozyma saopauloensis TaxID=291208 RepID=A0AAX4HDN6_9ASCO|nr:hypothetical protein PUMCH_004019 [[Candida] saopauloensis]
MGRRLLIPTRSNVLLWLSRAHLSKVHQKSLSSGYFSTSATLRDVAYTSWLKDNTNDHGDELGEKKQSYCSALGSPHLSAANAEPLRRETVTLEEEKINTPLKVLDAEIEIVKLFQMGEFAKMYSELAAYKAKGISVPAELLTEMASKVHQAIPVDLSREELHRSNIEYPLFYAQADIRLFSSAKSVSSHLYNLQKVFALYEAEYLDSPNFLESYIWLCYHTNELHTIQRLFHRYLQNKTYNSATLSHITNAFIYNYDVEFAKSLFMSIIGMQKPLDESYLSSTLVAFSQVKASYDNTIDIFRQWSISENCESPYPRTIALLLKQSNLYGSANEIAAMNEIADHLGYSSNFFVQIVRIQTAIINRDNNKIKTITPEDIESILEIRNGLYGSQPALKAFYESFLHFLCTYSSMDVVQFILKEMNKDRIHLTRFAYDSIATHYISTRKFISLFKFMKKFLLKTIKFEPIYGKYIFDGFIRSYPYFGETFAERMTLWLGGALSQIEQQKLVEACKLRKLASSLNPYATQSGNLDSNPKYDSEAWKDIEYNPNKPYLKLQRRKQMSFRTELGLREIMRKGISPDYSVIEDTLRNLGPAIRKGLLQALPGLRLTKYSLRLQMYDFILDRPDKQAFAAFVKKLEPTLNTSDRIFLARRALNKCDYEGCSLLLKLLNPLEMTDSRHMIVLNLKLRNSIQSKNFEAFDASIDAFPICDITLSPFMLKQSRFVEKMLQNKMRNLSAADNLELQVMKASLKKLHGLIGDIEVRLKKDTHDIDQLMNEVFEMLDQWVQATNGKVAKQNANTN